MKVLTKKDISKIFWQIVKFYYPEEEDEDVIDNETFLNEYEGDIDAFSEDVEETFGIEVDVFTTTIAEMIDFLDENKEKITLGDNVNNKLKWKSYSEFDEEDYD